MTTAITEDEFGELLGSVRHSAWRWETLDRYELGYEQADFERFLASNPEQPTEIPWWRDWLGQVADITSRGATVARVRVLAEPPTDYQRWMLWAHPWYARAHEDIRYMPRSRAIRLRLPLEIDWWLLDDERLILMYSTETGGIAGKILTTEPGIVARHRQWRDLAVRNATAAGEIAAA